MNIITISREFGSGGRELGKRLADILGYDYYDREILTAISQKQGLDEQYIDDMLSRNIWRNISLTYGHSFASSVLLEQQTSLIFEQTNIIREIAKTGKDCIIIGRNADVLLEEYSPFNIFVCADMEAKIDRCIERAENGEKLTRKDIEQNIRRIDKNRARTRQIVSDIKWGDRKAYHLIVNTTDWNIKELAPVVADYAKAWIDRTK